MSTQTEHLGLHQWEPEDNFLRSDFNQDFAKIDAAVGAAQALLSGYNASGILTSAEGPVDIDVGFRPRLVIMFTPASTAIHFISPVGAAFLVCKYQSSTDAGFNYFNHMALTETGFHIDKSAYYFSVSAAKPACYVAFR